MAKKSGKFRKILLTSLLIPDSEMMGWNKSNKAWANEYAAKNLFDTCDTPDYETERNKQMHLTGCIEYVKDKRKGSSRQKIAPHCQFAIEEAFDCSNQKSEKKNKRIDETMNLIILGMPYIIVAIILIIILLLY